MAILHYSDKSLIDEVTYVHTLEGHGVRAYLHAREDATEEDLAPVIKALQASKYYLLPCVHDGKNVIEVRGFKKQEEFDSLLRKNKFITTKTSTEEVKGDNPTAKEKFANLTMKLCGILYHVGDVGYAHYAWTHKTKKGNRDWFNVTAAFFYGLGSVFATFFGNRDKSAQNIREISQNLSSFIKKNNIDLPEDSTLKTFATDKKSGILHRASEFITRHTSDLLNASFALAGLTLGISNVKRAMPEPGETLKQAYAARKGAYWDIGLGSMTLASGLSAILIKEKKRDPDEPKRKGLGGFVDWIREKPNRAAGYGYMISTGFHAKTTIDEFWNTFKTLPKGSTERAKEIKTLAGRGVFVVSNLSAEAMLSLSSKGHGEGVKADDSVEQSVAAIAASTIAKCAADKREELIESFAKHLSQPKVMGGKVEHIAENIRLHLNGIQSNPWAKIMGLAPTESTTLPETTSEQPVKEASENKEKSPAPVTQISSSNKWQQKTPQKTIDPQPLSEKPLAASPGLGI